MQIARVHNLTFPLLYGHFLYGITLTGKGAYDEAYATLEEGLALAEKVGNEVYHKRMLNCLGWLYIECGVLDRAIDLNRRSADEAWKRCDTETIANAELNLGDIFMTQGELSLAQETFEGIYRLVHDSTTSDWMKWRYSMHLFASLGEFWLARDNPVKTMEFINQCLDIATRTNSRKYMVRGWRLQGQAELMIGNHSAAQQSLQKALALAQAIANPTQLWRTHLAWGQLHEAR